MSNPVPRPSLRERVSAAIIDAAAGVLVERGDEASMNDVAAAAGVARATVYRYFPTREALLEALATATVENADETLKAARLDEVEVREGFTRAVRALVTLGDAFVVVARGRARGEHPAFDAHVTAGLHALIQRGQDAGTIRSDLPAPWLLESLLATTMTVLVASPSLGAEDTVHAIVSLFLDGAAASDQPPAA